ncbi:SDR family oxidoreductase [Gracilimonas mengyeensis]|uniref:NAD(P)H dehydrogenase (Quinone) n=1 Tax=Gracilimonas mengyeensis TaxID=1302730 RepID=A0A521CF81_9BACT|nr:SDR family oxidoreductase [Gracilimonas mengyeensis]SMO58079.1 NAD(P)H dehydrogenase (quinone) [Gracilimonas mengyeensis]
MILVTGANGELGSQTINYLLEKDPDANIAGLVRSEQKGTELKAKGIELRIGDYTDYASIENAMQGVDTLLLISSSTLDGRVKQHENVVEAAKDANVNHIFYTSIIKADKKLSPLSPDHASTEKLIKQSGIPYTIYRNTFYMEFLPLFLGDALKTGQWVFPSSGKPINLALRSEMAEALANGLQDKDQHKNKTYEITSGKSYTLAEIADMLSKAAGKKVSYSDISVPYFAEALQGLKITEEQAAMSLMTAETFSDGALDFSFDHLEKLLGRTPTDMQSFIDKMTTR